MGQRALSGMSGHCLGVMLSVMDKREGGGWAALPNIGAEEDAASGVRLSCDGETFELRPEQSGGTHYAWISGPNPGYGFTVSPTIDNIEQHQTNIRNFLSMIDPETGYIEED
jgi:hypothetical protein